MNLAQKIKNSMRKCKRYNHDFNEDFQSAFQQKTASHTIRNLEHAISSLHLDQFGEWSNKTVFLSNDKEFWLLL